MSDRNHRFLRKVPARLCLNPSNLADPFPHGGADLGEVRSPSFRINSYAFRLKAEEWGNTATEIVRDEEVPVLAAILSTWNSSALATMMGGGSGVLTKRGILVHGVNSQPAGTKVGGNVIYLSPENDEDPGVLLYRGVALAREGAEMAFQRAEWWGLPMVFFALPDSSGRTYAMGLRSELAGVLV